jgi:hypothetical protein
MCQLALKCQSRQVSALDLHHSDGSFGFGFLTFSSNLSNKLTKSVFRCKILKTDLICGGSITGREATAKHNEQ